MEGRPTTATVGHVARIGDLANKWRLPHDQKLQMTPLSSQEKKQKQKTVEIIFRKKKENVKHRLLLLSFSGTDKISETGEAHFAFSHMASQATSGRGLLPYNLAPAPYRDVPFLYIT